MAERKRLAGVRCAADDVVCAARAWIGTPYHHQASEMGVGTDCLGLVRGVYHSLYGFDAEVPPAYTRDWAQVSGTETLLAAARRHLVVKAGHDIAAGDVLVFRMRAYTIAKHAGIAATPQSMVHAMEGVAVSEVALTRWWRRRIAGVFSFPGVQD